MKKLLIIAVLVLPFFLFTGCKDLLDVEEDISFTIIIDANSQQESFSNSRVYDLAANVDVIEEYGSKIKEVSISRVDVWLSTLLPVEGQRFTGGSISVSRPDGSDITHIASHPQILLQNLLNNKTSITPDSEGLKLLGQLAADPPHRFQVHTQGTVNEGPITFTMHIEFTGKMVANPLN